MKNLCMLLVLFLLGGCAFGNTTNYKGISNFKPNYEMPPISLGVLDHRPYVLDGSKTPTYAGTIRSLGGIPYNVTTKSGKPLAEMIQRLIGASLAKDGFVNVNISVILPSSTTEEEAFRLLEKNKKKAVLLVLNDWYTHVYFNPIFVYDLKVIVVSTDGRVIASSKIKGETEYGQGKKFKNFAEVVSYVFGEMFNDNKIKLALTEEAPAAKISKINLHEKIKSDTPNKKAEPQKCSTKQILKMKDMGLTDDQITAACQ